MKIPRPSIQAPAGYYAASIGQFLTDISVQPNVHLFKGKESKKSRIITSFSYYPYQEKEGKKHLTEWSFLSHSEIEAFPAFPLSFYSSAFLSYLTSFLFYKG
jgi:hypothetical protein